MPTILIVDNHDLVREAVSHLLEREAGFQVIHAAGSLAEAMACPEEPDIIIVEPMSFADETDPLDGPALVAALSGRYPGSRVLALARTENPMDVQACLAAGAGGYMVKKATALDLVDAVKKVASGQEYLQPSLGATLLKQASAKESGAKGASSLNSTELDVLRMLALGHTNSEVAKILSFGLRTVEGYRSRIMDKLGVSSRAELVRAAFDRDLVYLRDEPRQSSSRRVLGIDHSTAQTA